METLLAILIYSSEVKLEWYPKQSTAEANYTICERVDSDQVEHAVTPYNAHNWLCVDNQTVYVTDTQTIVEGIVATLDLPNNYLRTVTIDGVYYP